MRGGGEEVESVTIASNHSPHIISSLVTRRQLCVYGLIDHTVAFESLSEDDGWLLQMPQVTVRGGHSQDNCWSV